jgi:DNA-binding NarL/FixJ family response regulator
MPIQVCIVEDKPDILHALKEIINMADGYECVATSTSGEDALDTIPAYQPDIVLMDINLGGINGIECVKKLKPLYPNIMYMMCTVYEDDEKIFDALKAGASAYILKKTQPTKLLDAIKELHEGGSPMSSQIARKVVAAFQQKTSHADLEDLSAREKEILEQLAKGLLYKEIAVLLQISSETVRKHVYHIYEKLHVTNRIEAVNKFFGR